MGILDKIGLKKIKDGLTKTRNNLLDKITNLFSSTKVIDDNFFSELEEILITADVGVNMTMEIISRLKERLKSERINDVSEVNLILKDELEKILKSIDNQTSHDPFYIPSDKKPFVIMIVGVNGVGKTTTIGKLAYNYKIRGKKVLIGAADTFRAAANEQLEIWAKRAGVDIIQQQKGSDPGAVAFDTLKSAIARNIDVVLIDTAGRLHTKSNLMEELKKVKRVMQKVIPDAPHEIWLVLDATTGQNAIQQARQFTQSIGVTGLIITKLDGTAKGGVLFAIVNELKIPVKFIGVGEDIDDLQPFDPSAFVDAIFEK
ncbi:signal recognition particle-docking protein FtsY [Candidatus Chrysopegis kryptomonas]|jgi:fused signal recognition particle receptor|uniref:Signal recognition particle receptor FtsY n=1 Tax=Candidatus Chryseopegocella kryptomonas TaxID=1633643 RepID=A0A0P1NXR9_9BACT|nr:signal recognition particle-docking protein FtsY [Candidatus Chrysopegis kryptomonas]CUT04218.1 signal recognition particle-docking protein FtsY [Candidatus Chrysopegis kryptomonas]